jgi:EAL domain-containing protein (putative c-di-GMP-specific phosphodiesterase class I)
VEHVSLALDASGLAPTNLLLEITEGALVNDVDTAIATLASLRALGVRLAIDDFGTGYSSLNYLRRLPVDVIKVDRTFVLELGRNKDQRALLRSIVGLARILRLEAIAEGIETPDQRDELRTLGVRLGQGFFFAGPLSAEQAGQFLTPARRRSRFGTRHDSFVPPRAAAS